MENDDTADIADQTARQLIASNKHDRVTINSDGTATVALHFPIQSGKETISELTIRRPRAKDLRKMDNSSGGAIDKGLVMITDCSRRAKSEIDELDGADVVLCTEVLGFLQQPPPRTGASSSAS